MQLTRPHPCMLTVFRLLQVNTDNNMYVLPSAATATDNSAAYIYGATSGTNMMKSNVFITASGTAVYAAKSNSIYQACTA